MKTVFKIKFRSAVQGHCAFQNGPIFAAERLNQLCFGADELTAGQIMEILQDKEHAFIDTWQMGFVGIQICVDIPVADFVVEIADAELDEISDVMLCEDGDKGPQLTIIVFGAVQKMTDFQGVPFC